MHYPIVELLKSTFLAVHKPLLEAIPAQDSPLLLWIRNQFLIYNYMILLLVSNPVFLVVQLLYGDGAVFVTFWEQITNEL